MSNIRLLGDKILVKLTASSDRSAGGVYLPDRAQKKPQEGTVMFAGPGRLFDSGEHNELSVKVGDRVLFSKWGGDEVSIDGQDYTMLDEDQVYAILKSEAA